MRRGLCLAGQEQKLMFSVADFSYDITKHQKCRIQIHLPESPNITTTGIDMFQMNGTPKMCFNSAKWPMNNFQSKFGIRYEYVVFKQNRAADD